MIIHAVHTNDDDCLIIRKKTNDYVETKNRLQNMIIVTK